MPELLKKLDCCIECLTKEDRTKDHIVGKAMAKVHPFVFGSFVYSDKNLAPLCEPDHQKADRNKIREFKERGVSGLINYLGEDSGYPKSPSERILLMENQ
jgi:hypothetical protein